MIWRYYGLYASLCDHISHLYDHPVSEAPHALLHDSLTTHAIGDYCWQLWIPPARRARRLRVRITVLHLYKAILHIF